MEKTQTRIWMDPVGPDHRYRIHTQVVFRILIQAPRFRVDGSPVTDRPGSDRIGNQ